MGGNPVGALDPTGEFGVPGAVLGSVLGVGSSLVGSVTTGGLQVLSQPGTWVSAGVAGAGGAISGFVGDVSGGIRISIARGALVSGLSNVSGQTANLRADNDPANDLDYNYGSIAGSLIGGGWAKAITPGAGPIASTILGWAPLTASTVLGETLGK